jgi:hypothetical protein
MKPKAIKISILVGLFFLFFAGQGYSDIMSPQAQIRARYLDELSKRKRSVTFVWRNKDAREIHVTVEFELETIRYSYADRIYKVSFADLNAKQKSKLDTLNNLLSRLSNDNNINDWGNRGYVFVVIYYENGLLKNMVTINDDGALKKAMERDKARGQTKLTKQYEARHLDDEVVAAFAQLYHLLIMHMIHERIYFGDELPINQDTKYYYNQDTDYIIRIAQ